METLLRWFLPIYLAVYITVAFLWRSYVVWKQTGINPYALGKADNAHDYVGSLFRVTMLVVALVIVLVAVAPPLYSYLTPITWLESQALVWVGIALLITSLLWVILAQIQMGSAWRIGIDERHETSLMQQGMFSMSRNPIFLGMRVTLLGFFLILPTAVTLVVLVLGDALMQIQVRLEEAYLAQVHGELYQAYRQRTPRWL